MIELSNYIRSVAHMKRYDISIFDYVHGHTPRERRYSSREFTASARFSKACRVLILSLVARLSCKERRETLAVVTHSAQSLIPASSSSLVGGELSKVLITNWLTKSVKLSCCSCITSVSLIDNFLIK